MWANLIHVHSHDTPFKNTSIKIHSSCAAITNLTIMLQDKSEQESPLLSSPDAELESGREALASTASSVDSVFGRLSSTDSKKGWFTRKRIIIISVLLVFLLMVPLTFLSIIPSEVKEECEHTSIEISVAHISNPTNEGFESDVTMRFSKGSPIPDTTIQMHDTYIKWRDVSGELRTLVKLSHTHQIKAVTGDQQLKSIATVVDMEAFTSFNQFSVDAGSILWDMSGAARVHALIDVEVDLDKPVTMEGFNNFSIPPVVQDVTVTGGSPTELYSVSNTEITSQANIALYLAQDLNFYIKSRGITIGLATIPNAVLDTGTFTSTSNVVMKWSTQQEYDELMLVLGRFMMGQPSNVTMENFFLTNTITWLEPGLDSIKMSSSLPGVSDALVGQINMYISLLHLINVPFDLHLFNPVDSYVEMQSVTCEIYFEGVHIADVDEQDIGLMIPPKTMVISPKFSARTDLKHTSTLVDLLNAKFGYLDLYCSMKSLVGEFPVSAVYNQMQVPAYLEEA